MWGKRNNPRIGYAWVVFSPHISPTSTYIIYNFKLSPPKRDFFINVNPNKFKLIFPTPIYISNNQFLGLICLSYVNPKIGSFI